MSRNKVYITSDLHLGHTKLLSFREDRHNQLFPSVKHWNDYVITKWNEKINPKDVVWLLGDVVMGDSNLELLNNLNGSKRLVLGNHDKHYMDKFTPYFDRIAGVAVNYGFVMTHVPIHPQELSHRWTHNVHGHIHHKERNIQDRRYINVNIDVRNGSPVILEQIKEEML